MYIGEVGEYGVNTGESTSIIRKVKETHTRGHFDQDATNGPYVYFLCYIINSSRGIAVLSDDAALIGELLGRIKRTGACDDRVG